MHLRIELYCPQVEAILLKLQDAERTVAHVELTIAATSAARAMRTQDFVDIAAAAGMSVVAAPARFLWIQDRIAKTAKTVRADVISACALLRQLIVVGALTEARWTRRNVVRRRSWQCSDRG